MFLGGGVPPPGGPPGNADGDDGQCTTSEEAEICTVFVSSTSTQGTLTTITSVSYDTCYVNS